MSCDESIKTQAEKICECSQKARNYENSDRRAREAQACGRLISTTLSSLYERSIREDWPKARYEEEREAFYKVIDQCN